MSETQIAERVKVEANAVTGLRTLPIEAAVALARNAMDATYVPNENSCRILRILLETAYTSSCERYRDRRQFLAECYARPAKRFETDIVDGIVLCLTGPAGVGKSKLSAALGRLLHAPAAIHVAQGHEPFPLQSHIAVSIRSNTSERNIKEAMRAQIVSAHASANDLHALIFRNGISLIIADEFQRMTQSLSAHTLVAKTIHGMSLLGVPLVYIANYSLCHKLLKRPQEERQRLLNRPIVLLPVEHDSSDWVSLVKEYCRIAPDIFTFDVDKAADALYQYTAGLGRLLRNLLLLALADALRAKREVDLRFLGQSSCSRKSRA